MKINKNIIIYSVVAGSILLVCILSAIKYISSRNSDRELEEITTSSDGPKASPPEPESLSSNTNNNMMQNEYSVKTDNQEPASKTNPNGRNGGFDIQPSAQVSPRVVNGMLNSGNNENTNLVNEDQLDNQEKKGLVKQLLGSISRIFKAREVNMEIYPIDYIYEGLKSNERKEFYDFFEKLLKDVPRKSIFGEEYETTEKPNDKKLFTKNYLKAINNVLLVKYHDKTSSKSKLTEETDKYLKLLRSRCDYIKMNIEQDDKFKTDILKLIFCKNFFKYFRDYKIDIFTIPAENVGQVANIQSVIFNQAILEDIQNIRIKEQREDFYNQYKKNVTNFVEELKSANFFVKELFNHVGIIKNYKPTEQLFLDNEKAKKRPSTTW